MELKELEKKVYVTKDAYDSLRNINFDNINNYSPELASYLLDALDKCKKDGEALEKEYFAKRGWDSENIKW